jgi:hypothetical protein
MPHRQLAANPLRRSGNLWADQLKAITIQTIGRACDAQRATYLTRTIYDRGSYTPNAHRDFLIIDGISTRAGNFNFDSESMFISDRQRGQGYQLHAFDELTAFTLTHGAQDGLALACAIHRLALAHGSGGAVSMSTITTFQGENLITLSDSKICGLASKISQRPQFEASSGYQIWLQPSTPNHLQISETQTVAFTCWITPNHPAFYQQSQQSVQRRARKIHLCGKHLSIESLRG